MTETLVPNDLIQLVFLSKEGDYFLNVSEAELRERGLLNKLKTGPIEWTLGNTKGEVLLPVGTIAEERGSRGQNGIN